jgi:hypothetical protein
MEMERVKKFGGFLSLHTFRGKTFYSLIILLPLAIVLSSCVSLTDPEVSQFYKSDTIAQVTPDQTVGQTFVSRRPRFDSINLWLETDNTEGTLFIELLQAPNDSTPLSTSQVNFTSVAPDKYTKVSFPTQTNQENQAFYLRLKTDVGEVSVLGRSEDVYPDGSAYMNDLPIDGDFAFRATYDYNWQALLVDVLLAVKRLWLVFPLGLIFFLPGILLLDLSGLRKEFDFCEQVPISLGLSITFIPIFTLWMTFLDISWSPPLLWIASALMGLFFFLRIWRRGNPSCAVNSDISTNKGPSGTITAVLLIGIFALTLLTRFAMVRDLAGPAWVDSVHHGLITRLIVNTGLLPTEYAPLLPPDIGYYHPGFHNLLALFSMMTGWDVPAAMLFVGQVLNALVIFSVYLLTTTLVKNRVAGLVAALITGVITPMPAYYASWGRYTQLTGLIILPVALAWVQALLEHNQRDEKRSWYLQFIQGCMLLGGTFLIHYRVTAFLGCLLLAYLIGQMSWRRLPKTISSIIWLGLGGILIILPWFVPTIMDLLLPKAQLWQGGQEVMSTITWRYLTPALGLHAMIAAGIGLLWGIIQRKRFIVTLTLWVLLLFGLANISIIGLPDPGFVNPTSIEITLFMPISVLGGYLISQVITLWNKSISNQWRHLGNAGMMLAGLVLAFIGFKNILPTLNPVTFILRDADFPAISWIGENIPPDETIAINPTGWGYGLYIGDDGGYWISPLTGRSTMPPPVLYGLGSHEFVHKTNEIIEGVMEYADDAVQLWGHLNTHDIKYIYLGARGGVMSPRVLDSSPMFETLYHQDGTWVFRISQNSAP